MLLTLTIVLTVLGAVGFAVAWANTDYNTGRAPQWAECVGMAGVAALAHAVLGGVLGWMGSYAGYTEAGYVIGMFGGMAAALYGVHQSWFGGRRAEPEPWVYGGVALLAIGVVAALLV